MPEQNAKIIGGRYRILEKLGEGGMGTVYAARDERLQRDVAIKRLHIFGGSETQVENFRRRFQREAVSMAQFIHPYIVPVYDYGDEDGWIYLVMGYMSGGSLQDRLGKPMLYSEAAELLLPVASALGYIHENGVIHRDVKPQNILFNRRGIPMLADFGIVKLVESDGVTLTAAGTGIGTPAYMAPEQITTTVDHHVDQYALGVVFYELVTGKKPFKGDTPVMTLIMHRTDALPDPRLCVPTIPDEVCNILQKVLSKDPHDRYADMDEFENALRGLTNNEKSKIVHPVEAIQSVADEFIQLETEQAEEATQLAEGPFNEEVTPEEEPAALVAEEETQISSVEPEAENGVEESEPIEEKIEAPQEEEISQLEAELVEEATQLAEAPSSEEAAQEEEATALMEEKTQISSVEPEAGSTFEDETEIAGMEEVLGSEEPTQLAIEEPKSLTPQPAVKAKKKFPLWIPIAGGVVVFTVILLFVTGILPGVFKPAEPTEVPQVAEVKTAQPTEQEEPEPEQEPTMVEEEPSVPEGYIEQGSFLILRGTMHLWPILEKVIEEFLIDHPTWTFDIQGISSDDGIQHIGNDEVDFGLSSRELYDHEREEFPNLEEFQIAWNPLVVFVHPDLDIPELNREELSHIFFGHVNNWAELGGPDIDIIRISPSENLNSYWNFRSCLDFSEEWITENSEFLDDEELIIREVAAIPGAIGFTSLFHDFEEVHVLTLEGIELIEDALYEGFWPMETPMFLITNGEPSEEEWYFLEYILSMRGKELITEAGYLPTR